MTNERADEFTLVVMGASGDLFERLLMPGLAALLGERPELRVQLLGTGRHDVDQGEWRERIERSLDAEVHGRDAERHLLEHTRWHTVDPTELEHWTDLLDGLDGRILVYFALPPAVIVEAAKVMQDVDLPEGLTVITEKPFGTDAASAAELDRQLLAAVGEDDLIRVDHFLGTGPVLGLLGLRLANRSIGSLWDAESVAAVDVVFDETLGLEGRADFYDSTGALEDMLQSHLLQILALIAMEPPASLGERDLRDQIAHALRATRLWEDDPAAASRRARYTAGRAGGKDLPDYVAEEGVDAAKETETFAEVRFAVDTQRWHGVPFTLRSGKALGADRHEVRLTLRPLGRSVPGLPAPASADEVLVVDLDSGEVRLELLTNHRGDPFRLESTALTSGPLPSRLPPYGEVLRAALEDDLRLSVRGDVAVRCWELIEPVQRAWSSGDVPMLTYPAGSDGPTD